MNAKLLETAIAGLLLATPAAAANVAVSDAWMRALPSHLPAGGYFTLKNLGTMALVLKGAGSPACGMLMLHQSTNRSGMSGMDMVDMITIPAGGTVKFSPGGYHLMCMDPTPALKPGAHVAVTLQFADGTKTVVNFAVKDARGK